MSDLRTRLTKSQPYAEFGVIKYLGLKCESFFGNLVYRRPPPRRAAGPLLLNLGCGNHKYEGWVNADFYNFHDLFGDRACVPDWMLDLNKPIRCEDSYWDGVFTEHTMEHLSYAGCFSAFSEIYRMMKPGAWLRVVVPDIAKYVGHYKGEPATASFAAVSRGAESIAGVTQGWGHRSVWDAQLLGSVLADCGFIDVRQRAFGEGSDPRLTMDSPGRAWESLYVESRKPPVNMAG